MFKQQVSNEVLLSCTPECHGSCCLSGSVCIFLKTFPSHVPCARARAYVCVCDICANSVIIISYTLYFSKKVLFFQCRGVLMRRFSSIQIKEVEGLWNKMCNSRIYSLDSKIIVGSVVLVQCGVVVFPEATRAMMGRDYKQIKYGKSWSEILNWTCVVWICLIRLIDYYYYYLLYTDVYLTHAVCCSSSNNIIIYNDLFEILFKLTYHVYNIYMYKFFNVLVLFCMDVIKIYFSLGTP